MKKQKTKNTPGFPTTEVIKGAPAILISQAIERGSNLEQLEKLLVLREHFEANEAKKAYHKAMAQFKANLPQIIKDKKVSYSAGGGTVKYNYSSLYNVINSITPKLSEFGLSIAWIHKQTEKEIFVTTRITHELGYSEETTIGAPADTTGAKNAIQAIGSSITYLERYGALGLIGAATKDQDDDARTIGVVEYITDKELHFLRDNFVDLNISEKKFCEYIKIESLEKMPKTEYSKALVAVEAKRKQVKK